MERSTILKGKLTISMAIFNSYVKLPESICTCLDIDIYPFCICWLIDHDWSIYENCLCDFLLTDWSICLVDVSTWHSARCRSLKKISPWASLSRRQLFVRTNGLKSFRQWLWDRLKPWWNVRFLVERHFFGWIFWWSSRQMPNPPCLKWAFEKVHYQAVGWHTRVLNWLLEPSWTLIFKW